MNTSKPLCPEPATEFGNRDHRGLGPSRQRNEVTDVVLMPVSDQHEIRVVECLQVRRARTVRDEPRVDDHLHPTGAAKQEACVS